MIIKDIKDIPVEIKDRIEKSNVILYNLTTTPITITPKKIDDYSMISVFNKTRQNTIYLNKNDESRVKMLEDTLKYFGEFSLKYVYISDAVIEEDGYIFKNRWGIHDDNGTYTKDMDSLTLDELEEKYKKQSKK